jgi:hypothetical protein
MRERSGPEDGTYVPFWDLQRCAHEKMRENVCPNPTPFYKIISLLPAV